jgi:hypothetical protein
MLALGLILFNVSGFFFFLEHAGQLCVNILRRKKGVSPSQKYKGGFIPPHIHTHTRSPVTKLNNPRPERPISLTGRLQGKKMRNFLSPSQLPHKHLIPTGGEKLIQIGLPSIKDAAIPVIPERPSHQDYNRIQPMLCMISHPCGHLIPPIFEGIIIRLWG